MQRVRNIRPANFFLICLLSLLVVSCLKSKDKGIPLDVVETLHQAQSIYRTELNKTIAHYYDSPDTAKREALYYLLRNLMQHYWVLYHIADSVDTVYSFNPFAYNSFTEAKQNWDSLKKAIPGLQFKGKKFVRDIDTIRGNYLIENIEQAFKTREFAWTKNVSDTLFYEYVLPYRVANEPISDWRREILSDFSWLIDSLRPNTPDLLIQFVDDYINEEIKIDNRYTFEETLQDYNAIKISKRGSYEEIAILKAYIMRAFGIPATIDYIPYLNDSCSAYYFAVASNQNGGFSPMYPIDASTVLKLENIAKVYRRVYRKIGSSLINRKPISLTTPLFIGHYSYEDVTENYIPIENLNFTLDCPDTLIYIAIHKDGNWRAVDWALCENNGISFEKMCKTLDYKLMYMEKDSLLPVEEK